MTDSQKLDLLLSGMKEVKTEVCLLKEDTRTLKKDVHLLKKNTQTLKDNLQKLNKKAETLENRKIHMEPMPENEIRVNIQRVAK